MRLGGGLYGTDGFEGAGTPGTGAVGTPVGGCRLGPSGNGAPTVGSEYVLPSPLTIEPFARTPIEGVPEVRSRKSKRAREEGRAANSSTADNIPGRAVDRPLLRFFLPRFLRAIVQDSCVGGNRDVGSSPRFRHPRRREVLEHLVIRFPRAKTEEPAAALLVVAELPAARKIAFTMLAEEFLALSLVLGTAEHSTEAVKEH